MLEINRTHTRRTLPCSNAVLACACAYAVGLAGCATPTDAAPGEQSLRATQSAVVGTDTLSVDNDPAGRVESYSKTASSLPATGFFANLGTNGRTCGSCHLQENGWSITPAFIRTLGRFDSLFAPVDGSDCPPTTPTQTADAHLSTQMLNYGLVRVQIAIPAGSDFALASATNPGNCKIAPGSSAIDGKLLLFRRPLPSTNLVFNSAIMWDGRETIQPLTTTTDATSTTPLLFDLADQANGATTGHAEGAPISATVQADIVSFETGLFTAQTQAQSQNIDLTGLGANGGASFIANTLATSFFIGKNDPLKPGFTNATFDVYAAWEPTSAAYASLKKHQQAIGRGEAIFNDTTFVIHDVPGLNSSLDDPLYDPNDPFAGKDIVGGCAVCHNSPNIGNHSTSLAINIGVTLAQPRNNDGSVNTTLDLAHLPVYTLTSGTRSVAVTDPGRALITGRFVDSGKTKGPILRGLASRAPYFHNGSAVDLKTVVDFYNARFAIGLSPSQIGDLVAFLGAL